MTMKKERVFVVYVLIFRNVVATELRFWYNTVFVE